MLLLPLFEDQKHQNWTSFGFWPAALCLSLLASCSTAPKTTPELSQLRGKSVALTQVDGEETSRSVAEVALINQLLQHGTFRVISKKEVEAARTHFAQDPTDWQGIARRAGADYALRIETLEFDSKVHEGYSEEKVYDSQIAAERGEDEGNVNRLFKVKKLSGKVKFRLQFANLENSEIKEAVAEEEGAVTAEARTQAARLPPRLRFLEDLSNRAFRKFFDEYR